MTHSFMMSIVAHILPPRKGGTRAHALSLPTWRYPAPPVRGHGRPVQSYAVPCFTGAVGSRGGLAGSVAVVLTGSVAAAKAAGAEGGVMGVGFASTRAGAWGGAAGAESRAGARAPFK